MAATQDSIRRMHVAFRDDPWLAGFIDGEGCFTRFSVRRRTGEKVYYPAMRIGLRWDDRPLLEALRDEFGGSVCDGRAKLVGRRQPHFVWSLSERSRLRVLISYLETFPLRSKKARQFAAWRAEHGL